MNHLFILSLSAAHAHVSQVLPATQDFKITVLNIYSQEWKRNERDWKETEQSWHLCLNYWKSNCTFLLKKGLLLTPPCPSRPNKSKKYYISLCFCICFYYHCPSSCARTDLTGEKKLVRVLHLSLVGVYKINIIPPMGEKVKFIPRQAAVWQTKFLSVKISYWDFSIYSNKTKQKKSYRSVFTFYKKLLTRMKPWTWCKWNCNGDTAIFKQFFEK